MDRKRQADTLAQEDTIDEKISTLTDNAERAPIVSAPAETIADQMEYVDEP